MKLSVLDWLLWVVKAVVSALLFVFMGIGGILVTRSAWTSANWLLELQAAWARQQPLVIIVGLVVVVLWLLLIRHFYEAVLLNRLIEAVSDLAPRVRDTESEGLPEKRWGRRLRPLVTNVNGVFDAAQAAMAEEREIERSKDEMITNVSHDLRTPLTSILGYLGLIINDEDEKLARKDLVKYANTAFSKAGQMKSLVEDLFDYTQVHQVDFKLRWAPLDLAAMLQQLAVNYELEAKNKHVVVSAVTNPDTIEMVGDPDRLARVFMNLINNALKYGDGATFVRLTAKTNKSENYVEVRVQNNGEKIPADSIKRLFDRFYRVESSRNTKTGGTGLGLAIVNGVVEAHGGTVRVESDDDLTSFIVQLPLQPELGNEA
ncbi:two-component sensor histidine kinase [Weissella cibaria]|uniref:histidine kinase n=1 Tax=Weissella cibaria TaxID=137591 RepID=A0A1X4JNV5_9LACO|nr:HAMP domain-containing sensor histidine kinase [Weissella cibaria]OSP90444.1 two-component sensor histidine kinase [Weissella cibaria]